MQRPRHTRSRRHAGFSILELLLVLVILSILAGIVGVRFAGQSGKAKVKAATVQLDNLGTALRSYEIEIGSFPNTQQGLEALYEQPSGVDDWDGPYMEQRVEEDPWGNAWQYRSPGSHNDDYDLYSYGPDGREGGGDDITNWSEDD
jgi:general secretion pathway protein G